MEHMQKKLTLKQKKTNTKKPRNSPDTNLGLDELNHHILRFGS